MEDIQKDDGLINVNDIDSISTDKSVSKTPPLSILQQIFVVVSGAMVTLVSSAVYGTNVISTDIAHDFGFNPKGTELSLLVAFGLVGMQFTFVGGIVYDNLGSLGALFIGALFTIGGFQAASFCTRELFGLMVFVYTFVGIGQGMTFLSAFATVIKISNGGGPGVALVSVCMSLSLSFTVFLTNIYKHSSGCTEHSCWRNYMRLWSLVCVVFYTAGVSGLAWNQFRDAYYARRQEAQSLIPKEKQPKQSYFKRFGFAIFEHWYFYPLFVSYACAIGSCVLVLGSADQMWFEYKGNTNDDKWSDGLLLNIFSFSNAASGFTAAIVSDFLDRRGYLKFKYFSMITLLIFGVNYIVLGVLNTLRHKFTTALFGVLLGLNGAGFGVYVTIFPLIIAQIYGNKNFGIYFAWVLLGAGISSVATPPIVSAVHASAHSYTPMYFGFGAVLLAVVLPLFFVPEKKYKYREDF